MYKVNNYSLTVEGIGISYEKRNQVHHVNLDPMATCQALKDIGAIKDFTEDRNREPIVQLYGGTQDWTDVVKLFSLDRKLPLQIADYHCKQLGNPYRHSLINSHNKTEYEEARYETNQ